MHTIDGIFGVQARVSAKLVVSVEKMVNLITVAGRSKLLHLTAASAMVESITMEVCRCPMSLVVNNTEISLT